MRHILLLRGINVGSRNRIAMPELRELLTRAGLDDVRTYLQSGNVVVSSDAAPEALARECERQIANELGLDVDVVVRTRDELADVVGRNPLGRVAVNPKRYQVSFLSGELDPEALRELAALVVPPEQQGWGRPLRPAEQLDSPAKHRRRGGVRQLTLAVTRGSDVEHVPAITFLR